MAASSESAEMSNSRSCPEQSDRARNGWPEAQFDGSDVGTPGMSPTRDIVSDSSRNGGEADDTKAIHLVYSRYLDAAKIDPAWESRDLSNYDDLPEYNWTDIIQPSSRRRMAPPSETLYVEGLPFDCTGRELAHIFRPFLGYKAITLIEAWDTDGYLEEVIGFAEFDNASNAAAALSQLQGYQMIKDDPYSARLQLRFC